MVEVMHVIAVSALNQFAKVIADHYVKPAVNFRHSICTVLYFHDKNQNQLLQRRDIPVLLFSYFFV